MASWESELCPRAKENVVLMPSLGYAGAGDDSLPEAAIENMKNKRSKFVFGAAFLGIATLTVAYQVPFVFLDEKLSAVAVAHVESLQVSEEMSPRECAERYLFFEGDYGRVMPERITVTSTDLGDGLVRIGFTDLNCADDGVAAVVFRVYLKYDGDCKWSPIRSDWSARGRGRLHWGVDLPPNASAKKLFVRSAASTARPI